MTYAARLAALTCFFGLTALNVAYASPLTIATDFTSAGSITLTTSDAPAAGDNLTIAPGVTVTSTGGDIMLNVGDDLTLGAGSTVHALGNITILLDFGNADAGVGSTATLAGALIGQHVTIAGGPDVDTLVFQGPAALVTFTGSGNGTISAPGMTDIIFNSIEQFQGNITFAAPVPEPGSWLLVAAAGVASLLHSLRRPGRSSRRGPQ